MPAPPMPDKIKIHANVLGDDGKPVFGPNGKPEMTVSESRARVKQSSIVIVDRSGQQVAANLEISVPTSTEIRAGYIVEWTDEWGVTHMDTVEDVSGPKSYSGKVTYFRKAITVGGGQRGTGTWDV